MLYKRAILFSSGSEEDRSVFRLGVMAHLSLFVIAVILVARGSAAPSIYDDLYKYVAAHGKEGHFIPIEEVGEPFPVAVNMGLVDISEVDREHNEVEVAVVINLEWNTTLTWRPSDHNGVIYFNPERNLLWFPQMVIMNTATPLVNMGTEKVFLASNGMASTSFYYRIKVMCDLSDGDHCKISLSNSIYPNSILTFKDPATLSKIFGEVIKKSWRHKNPAYPIAETRLKKEVMFIKGMTNQLDRMHLEFSFKDPHRHHRHGSIFG